MLLILECATFLLVVGIAWWAWQAARKQDFDEAARLPFEYDANPVDEGGRQ